MPRASSAAIREWQSFFVFNATAIRPKQIPSNVCAKLFSNLERRTFMRHNLASVIIAAVLFALPISCMAASANNQGKRENPQNIQVGPRPYYLVEDMDPSPLKHKLRQCSEKPLLKTDFSIGHRGAALQFPEHTKESYTAAARMGAGIVECDVTFTKDKQLVCRHAQNDLHTTTNILETPLAKTCIKGFTPAEFNPDGSLKAPASAECRTSEITLAEFKTLKGKMDAFNPRA